MKKKFNEEYKKENCLWSMNPSPAVSLLTKYKSSGSVLDLGTGEGRNAIFLAKKGFNVTAVDFSEEGIKKLEKYAKKYKVRINTFIQDIRKFNFDRDYDVIISMATLHFLKEKEVRDLIKKIKKHTSKNGINIISVFTEENPEKNFPYLFKIGELKSFYKNWEILGYKETMTPMEKHGKHGKWHNHGIAVILAKKN